MLTMNDLNKPSHLPIGTQQTIDTTFKEQTSTNIIHTHNSHTGDFNSQIHCSLWMYWEPMVKWMKLPSILKSRKPKTSWKWSPLKHIRTISFRAKDVFKSANSALSNVVKMVIMLDSSCSQSKRFSAIMLEEYSGSDLIEMAVEALRSKRLSFDEPGDTSFITGATCRFPFQDNVVQAMESNNPYTDFRNSMEEMVEAYGLKDYERKDWDYLEELLAWYLRMNKKKNHRYIVEAFIDMYAALPSCSSFCSFSYHASPSSSKSKDWWEIEVESIPSCSDKGKYPKYCWYS